MKYLFRTIGFLVLSLLLGSVSLNVTLADEQNFYGITVVKFAIEDESKVAKNFPEDGLPVEQVQDDEGNNLTPLAGVHYTVERVIPGPQGFELLNGEDKLKMEVVTDEKGIAHFERLPQGAYRVIEQPNEKIAEVMDPVVLELPLPPSKGEPLDEVYLYPKSSVFSQLVTPPNVSDQPNTQNPEPSAQTNLPNQPSAKDLNRNYQANFSNQSSAKNPSRIPQTNGTIGNVYPIVWSISFVFLMGVAGVASIHWKKRKF